MEAVQPPQPKLVLLDSSLDFIAVVADREEQHRKLQ